MADRRFPGELVFLCVCEVAAAWICCATVVERVRPDGPGPAAHWLAPASWEFADDAEPASDADPSKESSSEREIASGEGARPAGARPAIIPGAVTTRPVGRRAP
jgi:hypothetical protein